MPRAVVGGQKIKLLQTEDPGWHIRTPPALEGATQP